MTRPPDGKVPAPGGSGRRDQALIPRDQLDKLDLTPEVTRPDGHVSDLPGWEAFARWLGAVT